MSPGPSAHGLVVRLLASGDEAVVQRMFEADPAYFEMVEGRPPASNEFQQLVTELPPGKTYIDKFVYGLFSTDCDLVGVIDLVRDYPEPKIWFLGLIFLSPEARGKGLGTEWLGSICEYVRRQGGEKLRLGVVDTNPAKRLYVRLGFALLYQRNRKVANGREISLSVLERPV